MTTGVDFWRGVVGAGGSGTVPRWAPAPVPGIGEHPVGVPAGLFTAVRRLADELAVPAEAVLLAGHVRVLAALTGEHEVLARVVVAPGTALPCRVTLGAPSWRVLVADVARRLADVRRHAADAPAALAALHPGPGADAIGETVFDPAGAGGALDEGTVLGVGVTSDTEVLLVRHHTDVLDRSAAGRIAGYHLAAWRLMTTDPDADPARGELLDTEEHRFQIDGLAGPRRELPDRRVHEIVADQVRARPDAVAAVHGSTSWTYRELDARVHRLGRALLARGLGREDVVAVVTERDLDWLAAVLAVFAAGGVYLPVEPHFPAERIATVIARSGCRLVISGAGPIPTLDAALDASPGVVRLPVEDAYAEQEAPEEPGTGLGVAVDADQLAYIYFTSGSTGTPKGAMCEHEGMLNHLRAKIADMGVAEGGVVAQTAPQCFDISLWQLVSALLVGGTTLIVEQEAVLDVPRFVDTVVDGGVAVLQVVPSYLDVVLSYLEGAPRGLGALACVAVTGEAVKKELVVRWFATAPHIPLVNAYGLTETSDDTNHEVMHGVPVHDRVPLGSPIDNVHVYVVDEHLSPVPLGAPGEIVFSGVCVGRGYVHDPERTAAAFLPDPHRPGERLYRSGDHGRWLPEGKLEFLGRRDAQVKISGFRIEIGEIENALLRAPGVRDAAVVVAEGADRDRHLVGFHSGPAPLDPTALRETLGASLPPYMVPAVLHHRETLPLTDNGKIDKLALTVLAAELEAAGPDVEAPRTEGERRVAAAWATVLGVEVGTIGRGDHFFDRGGTSLSAVKVSLRLDRALSLSDLIAHPVLSDLGAVLDGRGAGPDGLLQVLVAPTPGAPPVPLVVCFPHAGGHAVGSEALARALRGSGPSVAAVALPGHDPTAEDTAFAPLDVVADRVADEVATLAPAGTVLWGHSAGAAAALVTARRLVERGIEVRAVVVAAQLPGDAGMRRESAAAVSALDDASVLARLRELGVPGIASLDERRALRVAAAYRHDVVAADRAVADALSATVAPLEVPLTVVLAADDPRTAGPDGRHRDWERLAGPVELVELEAGGHWFPRTRPDLAADAVLGAVGAAPRP